MRTLSRLVAAGVALVAAAALAAPAAQADSIAYVKGGDVWLSTSDGERQFQVTSTGAYQDVSQADDGTMIALSGVRLHKLDRHGQRARRLRHPGLRHAPARAARVLRARSTRPSRRTASRSPTPGTT